MGNINQSQRNAIVMNITNEIINSVSTKYMFQATNICNTNQKAVIHTSDKSEIKGCSGNIIQVGKSLCTLEANSDVTIKNDLTADIEQKLKEKLTSKQESLQGFLATASSTQKMDNLMQTEIKNIAKSFVENDVYFSCANQLTINQDGELYIEGKWECAPGGVLTISQEALIEAASKCSSKLLADNILSNKIVSDIIAEMDAEQIAKQEGLSLTFLFAILLIFLAPSILVLFTSSRLLMPVRNPETGRVELLPWAVNLTVLIIMWAIIIALLIKLWNWIKDFFKRIFDKLDPRNWF